MAAPTYISDDLGADNDTLAIVINGQKVVTSIGWEHTEAILSQPSSFSVRFGWADVAAGLIQQFPKHSLFELYVGTNQQATGFTDAVECAQPPGGASTVTIRGRDKLAKLHDTSVRAQVPVKVGTYADLVWYALRQCGLVTASTVDPTILRTDNVANRQIKSGVPIRSILPHRTVQQILDDAGEIGPNAGTVHTTPQAKIGETWLHFVRRYCDRAGLMLWTAADGTFVLSAPDGNQAPSYQLLRYVGTPKRNGNVVSCNFKDDAKGRHTEAIIYGRGGGKAFGRVKAKGGFVDQEMVDAGYGTPGQLGDQPLVAKDKNVHSNAEADFLARRLLAQEKRNGYLLEYLISGLTLPYIPGAAGDRAVVIPDTVIAVNDEHLGIQGNFYVETVTRRRSPETSTTLRLIRVEDLIFGSPDEEESD